MTLNDIKKFVAEAEVKGWLQSLKLTLKLSHVDYERSITGVVEIYDFILKQLKGFHDLGDLPSELIEVKRRFEGLKTMIIQIISENTVNGYKWNQATSFFSSNGNNIILSDTAEAALLAKLHHDKSKYYKAAYDFIVGHSSNPNKTDFIGYLLAYEFTSSGMSPVKDRNEVEKNLLDKTKREFQEQLNMAEGHLTKYLSEAHTKVIENSKEIDELLRTKTEIFDQWFGQASHDFNSYCSASKDKIKELEELFIEKLKLEAPAKYWSTRAEVLRKEGGKWLTWLIGFISFAVVLLVAVLGLTANGTIDKIFDETATAIKWSVVLITLISFLAYGIKIFSKLTFSAFHLVRDAEEREQLTFVYLALQKEKGVDSTERHLIMQSIFSRADSGLLRDEGSPTMPGNIFDQAMKGK